MIIKITENQLKNILKENINNEGIDYKHDVNGHITSVKYNPFHNRNVDTRMFKDGTKEFNAIIKKLPKTNVTSINLYNLKNLDITKIWKKGENQYGEKVKVDRSMEILFKKNVMYITAIINKYMPDVDYIVIPSSSSNLNTRIIKSVANHLSNTELLKFGFDVFIKNIKNIQIDYDWLNKVVNTNDSLSYDELERLKRTIDKWINIDEPIRDFRRKIESLKNEINTLQAERAGKRGRPKVKDILDKKSEINQYNKAIYNLRHSGKKIGVDPTIDNKGNIKNWQIKSLEDKIRKAIKGFMTLNPKYNNLVNKFKNKKILIFDDNISSGATVDDCCLALQKVGVSLKDILVITLGVMNPTVYKKSDRAFINNN